MPEANDPTTSPDDPIDAVIAAYMQQVEAGEVPDREALLAALPDLADRLRAFFADYDQLDRRAALLMAASAAALSLVALLEWAGRPGMGLLIVALLTAACVAVRDARALPTPSMY